MKKTAPELLLVDIGNTTLKWALARACGPFRLGGEIATKKATTSWIADLARKYPDRHLILSSVVPRLVPVFQRAFANRIENVTGNSRWLNLTFDYPKPTELGADRIAAAVAAHEAGGWPVIIASLGTASAFTVLDAKGRLCGGAIAPGLEAQLAALIGSTAQLPQSRLSTPRTALARSTQEAIRAGVLLSFQGGVKEIVHQLVTALPGPRKPPVLLTGGNARHVVGKLGVPAELRPLLVLEGLRIIGARLGQPRT
jgi:type III pantothenate kinase